MKIEQDSNITKIELSHFIFYNLCLASHLSSFDYTLISKLSFLFNTINQKYSIN